MTIVASPPELLAVLLAAKRSGDTSLERATRRLLRQFGIRVILANKPCINLIDDSDLRFAQPVGGEDE